jgi:hypothetical protein
MVDFFPEGGWRLTHYPHYELKPKLHADIQIRDGIDLSVAKDEPP